MTLEKVVLLADHLGTCTTVILPKTVHTFFFSHQDKKRQLLIRIEQARISFKRKIECTGQVTAYVAEGLIFVKSQMSPAE